MSEKPAIFDAVEEGKNVNVLSYETLSPQIAPSAYIAEGVAIIGDVSIGENASVWFNTVLRGDIKKIKIGAYTNIQDNSTVHVMSNNETVVGDYVTIGHGAIVHGCTVGNNCLIGMGAILLGYCTIGENSIIAAGTLVTEHTIIPANSMVMGSPGRIVRSLREDEIKAIRQSAINYHEIAQKYKK